MTQDYSSHKLLIANRGEIAVRIIRTAKSLGLRSVAVYTRTDADAAHVLLASESYPINPDEADDAVNARGYMDSQAIVAIARQCQATLIHPGYGFLSENQEFSKAVLDAGITWLGPSPDVIRKMGLKDEARKIAAQANVPVVPGSDLLVSEEDAEEAAQKATYPVMLKAAGGGGGIGLVICKNAKELKAKFAATRERAKVMFKNDGVFLERYIPASRHVEVQVFGNGKGHAIHMGERECSVQRRHQKVIEETPSPFMLKHPDVRASLCDSAVKLCNAINYSSAGTCEFLVDDKTGSFYFLEMNTRLQVEHTVTEEVNPGLDLVELMIKQGIAERESSLGGLEPEELRQDRYSSVERTNHSIQARIYCENPSASFAPSPGLLQVVEFPQEDWLRIDNWVASGTNVPHFFDPLACKIVVRGATREESRQRLALALSSSKIFGPPNNIDYLKAIVQSETFKAGNALTTFLDTFKYQPKVMDVITGGVETTIQDYPGRTIGYGLPRSGPMDALAFRAGNIIVGNDEGVEGLEICVIGPKLLFHVDTIIAVTGAPIPFTLNKRPMPTWQRIVVPAGGRVEFGAIKDKGFRAYLCIRGGFPQVPKYLDSKSTSMGLGGYQGRSLSPGDQLALGDCGARGQETSSSGTAPEYPAEWTIYCLAGPQDDGSFLSPSGRRTFYETNWKISSASNRMGIRLEGPKIDFARENGGEGGSHPSNILDNGYALGSVNLNGDTPVILTNEGPDMGGYMCAATIASADLWKVGQLRPGATIRFQRISFDDARDLSQFYNDWLRTLNTDKTADLFSFKPAHVSSDASSILHAISANERDGRPSATFRQAGDSAILVEYGAMTLDLNIRARAHLFETEVMNQGVAGIRRFAPCTRSTMCHYDPAVISQATLLSLLVKTEMSLPATLQNVSFPGRKLTLPIVLDDRWNRGALEQYMRTIRDKAVYLPSNISYLANNNGLGENGGAGEEKVLKLLSEATWLTVGVGFYLGCPFLVPVDPRSRVIGQKMNPSRTFTPSGAIGIAGVVAAIYPVDSPGGYQLFGRTLPVWQTWARGEQFTEAKPWLMQPFDQVVWEVIDEAEYVKLERLFRIGKYTFKIEPSTFSMDEYNEFVKSIEPEIRAFKEKQATAVKREEAKETELLNAWEESKTTVNSSSMPTSGSGVGDWPDDLTLRSTVHGSITKLTPSCEAGHKISSAEEVLLVLEAMKTQINVEAGEENIGRVIKGVNVKVGGQVKSGDVLVLFNE